MKALLMKAYYCEGKKDYINFKLQKAAQSLKEARLLMQNDMHDTAVSRLYYAAFYAVNALLIAYGFNPKTHSGSKTIFNKEFILTGKIDSRFSDFYSFLMAKRFEADYDDFAFIDETKMLPLYVETEEFIALLIEIIKTDM